MARSNRYGTGIQIVLLEPVFNWPRELLRRTWTSLNQKGGAGRPRTDHEPTTPLSYHWHGKMKGGAMAQYTVNSANKVTI